ADRRRGRAAPDGPGALCPHGAGDQSLWRRAGGTAHPPGDRRRAVGFPRLRPIPAEGVEGQALARSLRIKGGTAKISTQSAISVAETGVPTRTRRLPCPAASAVRR